VSITETSAPSTLAEIIPAGAAGDALRVPGRAPITYDQLRRATAEIAGGLAVLGVTSGDRVAILASTRPEWVLADLGALQAGAVVVPVYHTNSRASRSSRETSPKRTAS
jgi:long-chain acyl-CoA synthetase